MQKKTPKPLTVPCISFDAAIRRTFRCVYIGSRHHRARRQHCKQNRDFPDCTFSQAFWGAVGKDLPSAFSLASGMEFCAEVQYRAMCAGKPFVLPDDEMRRVIERFKGYVQTP